MNRTSELSTFSLFLLPLSILQRRIHHPGAGPSRAPERLLRLPLSQWLLLTLLLLSGPLLLKQAGGASDAARSTLSRQQLEADQIVERLIAANQQRGQSLPAYVVPTTYRVVTPQGKVRAEAEVLLRYLPPNTKEFEILSERGSSLVRNRVFHPLMEVEVESAAGRNQSRSAISPANYAFSLVGEEILNGTRCYVLQAEPKRIEKSLFRGKIWVDAEMYAVVRIAGQLAKSPSFWISRVDFIRSYRKVGSQWLPSRNESITKVKISGRNILTIEYGTYLFPSG